MITTPLTASLPFTVARYASGDKRSWACTKSATKSRDVGQTFVDRLFYCADEAERVQVMGGWRDSVHKARTLSCSSCGTNSGR